MMCRFVHSNVRSRGKGKLFPILLLANDGAICFNFVLPCYCWTIGVSSTAGVLYEHRFSGEGRGDDTKKEGSTISNRAFIYFLCYSHRDVLNVAFCYLGHSLGWMTNYPRPR